MSTPTATLPWFAARLLVDEADLREAMAHVGVDEGLFSELLQVAFIKYKNMDYWGSKTDYQAEVREVILDAVGRSSEKSR